MRNDDLFEIYLDEIETIKMDNDINMSILIKTRYENLKDQMKNVGKLQNLKLMYVKTSDGRMRFYLVDEDGTPVGFMLFVEETLEHYTAYKVSSIWFEPHYRNRGIAGKLYDGLLGNGLPIISDHQQTIEAQGMWKSFLKKYRMFMVNQSGNIQRITSEQEFNQAYHDNNNRLLITK